MKVKVGRVWVPVAHEVLVLVRWCHGGLVAVDAPASAVPPTLRLRRGSRAGTKARQRWASHRRVAAHHGDAHSVLILMHALDHADLADDVIDHQKVFRSFLDGHFKILDCLPKRSPVCLVADGDLTRLFFRELDKPTHTPERER
jgi:hypothetical protein